MKKILVEIVEGQCNLLDELVRDNIYSSRNDAIREAIRDLLQYHKKI